MNDKSSVKLIAMYFPQLHAIPENDQWWGKGFTDWVNVKKGKPLFQGHNQPRVPLNNNYYDQSQLETLVWQIKLAKQYGIYGFCHYHYWFDGKQLLETPTNMMLENKDLDMPFCLSWANETWSRRWDGRDHQILIKQTHPPTEESWSKHFDYLIRAWTDERAIKIDGKPVFVIYRPNKIKNIDQMLAYWEKRAIQRGLKGVYFIFQKQYELPRNDCIKAFDAVFQFQPFEAIYHALYNKLTLSRYAKLRHFIYVLPQPIQHFIWFLWSCWQNDITFYEYDDIWKTILELREEAGLTTFPGAFIDWDNTARYGKKARIFKGANSERFQYWFDQLVKNTMQRPVDEQFIFINAWNEWAEGTYLEPDEKNGYGYLEAIRKVLNGVSD